VALKDFTLLAKLEALDIETHKIVKRYEKSEKHVLSAEIRQTVATMLHLVIRAAKTQIEERRKKRPLLNTQELLWQTDVEIEYMKLQVRKSYALRLINESCYEAWSRQILEIGGLLGGWLKTVRESVDTAQAHYKGKDQRQTTLFDN
jgi:hypothetical protein